jgi:hypothetical protein
MTARAGLTATLIVVGLAAFAIGIVFLAQALLGGPTGDHAFAAWYSAAIGIGAGGCCVLAGALRVGHRGRTPE